MNSEAILFVLEKLNEVVRSLEMKINTALVLENRPPEEDLRLNSGFISQTAYLLFLLVNCPSEALSQERAIQLFGEEEAKRFMEILKKKSKGQA